MGTVVSILTFSPTLYSGSTAIILLKLLCVEYISLALPVIVYSSFNCDISFSTFSFIEFCSITGHQTTRKYSKTLQQSIFVAANNYALYKALMISKTTTRNGVLTIYLKLAQNV